MKKHTLAFMALMMAVAVVRPAVRAAGIVRIAFLADQRRLPSVTR